MSHTQWKKAHLGAQNDAWFIVIGEAPAANNDHPRHDADRTAIARVFDEVECRRLVACWNALVDLPQDALDGGWTRAGLEAYGLQMKAERDALRAVNAELVEALEGLDEAYCRSGSPLDRAARNEDRRRLIAARAALTKAKELKGTE